MNKTKTHMFSHNESGEIVMFCGSAGRMNNPETYEPTTYTPSGAEKSLFYTRREAETTCKSCLSFIRRAKKVEENEKNLRMKPRPDTTRSVNTCMIQMTQGDKERIENLAKKFNVSTLVIIRHAVDQLELTLRDHEARARNRVNGDPGRVVPDRDQDENERVSSVAKDTDGAGVSDGVA